MTLLPISFLFIVYAINTFMWRMEKIRTRDPLRYANTSLMHQDFKYLFYLKSIVLLTNRWDDPMGPIVLTTFLVIALLVQFGINVL